MNEEYEVKSYALIDSATGKVVNTALWDGNVQVDFGVGIIAVLMPEGSPVSAGYSYEKGVFSSPPKTDEDKVQEENQSQLSNTAQKQSLFSQATIRISVLQDAVDLDMATEQEASALPIWKKYRVLLSRVDANTPEQISWPKAPDF